MRKTFKCGHRGFGRLCHRCQQALNLIERCATEKDEKRKAAFKEEGARLFTVPRKVGAIVAPAAPVPV